MNPNTAKTLENFDCLMICIQLAMSWDERLMKKLFQKHGLLSQGGRFDPAFALYQLHHEFHNPESGIVDDIVARLSKQHRLVVERLRSIPCEDKDPALLEITKDFLLRDPAGAFWALSTEDRLNMRSLSAYHAHRMILEAFRPGSGSFFAFERTKTELSERREELRKLRAECDELKLRLAAKTRENEALRKEQEEFAREKRELRKLRYEMEKCGRVSAPIPSRPPAKPVSNARTTIIDVDPPCPFHSQECCAKAEEGACVLENMKVALIGGIERLESQYRAVFESLGAAKFFFHSGHCEGGGAERLRSTTEAADVVVFITRVNSHNALNVLKGVCRKSGKSFLAVRETGPEQVSRAVLNGLVRNAERESTRGAHQA